MLGTTPFVSISDRRLGEMVNSSSPSLRRNLQVTAFHIPHERGHTTNMPVRKWLPPNYCAIPPIAACGL